MGPPLASSGEGIVLKNTNLTYTRKRVRQLENNLIFMPFGLLRLNPIKQVWDYLKWAMAPIVVENGDEFKYLIQEHFEKITQCISSAKKWCEKFLDFQKLS
jgi:transposase